MTLLDANILLYAYNAGAPEHATAKKWVENVFSGSDLVGLPWLTLWAFLRISTNPRLFPRPLAAEEAFQIVHAWIERPIVRMVEPGLRHAEILERFVVENQASGRLLTDAALAAVAIEHGAILASTDSDFTRFEGLRWLNPLAGRPVKPKRS